MSNTARHSSLTVISGLTQVLLACVHVDVFPKGRSVLLVWVIIHRGVELVSYTCDAQLVRSSGDITYIRGYWLQLVATANPFRSTDIWGLTAVAGESGGQ